MQISMLQATDPQILARSHRIFCKFRSYRRFIQKSTTSWRCPRLLSRSYRPKFCLALHKCFRFLLMNEDGRIFACLLLCCHGMSWGFVRLAETNCSLKWPICRKGFRGSPRELCDRATIITISLVHPLDPFQGK